MKTIVIFMLIAAAAGAAPPTAILPFLNCVTFDEETNLLTANFGYVSANSGDVVVDAGADNFISPAPFNRGQATVFKPGINNNAFQVTFNVADTPQIIWALFGQGVSASNDPTLYCSTCGCPPGVAGPMGSCGPQGPDATVGILLPHRTVSVLSPGETAVASCVSGEMLLSGGAQCSGGNAGLLSTSVSGLNWTVSCDGGQATAIAFCLSTSPPSAQAAVPAVHADGAPAQKQQKAERNNR